MKVQIRVPAKGRLFLNAILNSPYTQVGFGGARGGAKTFDSALAMVLRRLKYARTKGLMLRLTQKSADQNLGEELRKVLLFLGIKTVGKNRVAWWNVQLKQLHFYNGSYIQLGYCKAENDWEIYQGQEFMDICFEEATQFGERPFLDISGSNRQTVHKNVDGKVWITCNPGGKGTEWVKRRFINPKTRDPNTFWIKAVLRDNPAMLERDPGYRDRTLAKQPEWRRKQWEDGDWDSVEGQFFDLQPGMLQKVEPPEWADLYAGVDAGYFPSSFAVVWVAKWRGNDGRLRIHVWRELKKQRLNWTQQAHEATELEKQAFPFRRIKGRFADPAAWKRQEGEGGISTTNAHAWAMRGFLVTAAYTNARAAGWLLLRTLVDDGVLTIDPGLGALLTEMQNAVHDDKTDDIAGDCEDHLLDALRYALVSIFAGGFTRHEEDPYVKMQRLQIERKHNVVIVRSN